MRLTIELVPEPMWGFNLRSELTQCEWDLLRRDQYKRAGYVCEICGGKGDKHPVECHEVWRYDDLKNVQKLSRLIALCPSCHEVKHFGRARIMGNSKRAMAHLCTVNDMSMQTAENYILNQYALWRKRSQKKWTLDISYIHNKLKLLKGENSNV